MPGPLEPYLFFGTMTSRTGTVVASAIVLIENLRTGEIKTTSTNSLGQYVFDCGNFELGYNNGDGIKISGYSSSSIDMDFFVSLDAGKTWQEVNNNALTTIDANTTRKKVDMTNYSGGVELNITLIA